MRIYIKEYEDEEIEVGDVIYAVNGIHITRAVLQDDEKILAKSIVGICKEVLADTNEIIVEDRGYIPANITGEVTVGKYITLSEVPGKLADFDTMKKQHRYIMPVGRLVERKEEDKGVILFYNR